MAYIDVFNGDADGICALHQLRLANPVESTLVTGVKRDINLLKKVMPANGDQVTVLDISLDKNRDDLIRVLECGAQIIYFDHHFAGDIPRSDQLEAHINTEANVCTSLLVNGYLRGKYLAWAVAAAYGDNMFESARSAAKPLNLTEQQHEQLLMLGTCINYNGYGSSLDDLLYHPDALYYLLHPYEDPFDFINDETGYLPLVDGYQNDLDRARELKAELLMDSHAMYVFPNKKWARRVSAIYANELVNQFPDRAHAMLTELNEGDYLVSVRAPLSRATGADDLCRQFETGGGRKAAAGINRLPADQVDRFTEAFKAAF